MFKLPKFINNQKGVAPILLLLAALGVVAFLAVSSTAPLKNSLLSSLFPKPASQADTTPIPTPFPNCQPYGTEIPAGQSNPPMKPVPMNPIWCFPLVPEPTSRVTGANDWVDTFDTGVQMGQLNDHDMNYRIFNSSPDHFQAGQFAHNNHWMVDLAEKPEFVAQGFRLGGGILLSPEKTFKFENGKLVVETDVAAGSDGLGGADRFVEVDLSPAAAPTGTVVDQLYGYGQFGLVGSVGCRLEKNQWGGNVVCARYDDSGRDAGGTSVTGGANGIPGRLWETQGVGIAESGSDYFQLFPTNQVQGTNLTGNDVWRQCNTNDSDAFCRDRFRFEFTKDSIVIYVNGNEWYHIKGIYTVNPGPQAPGVNNTLPDSWLTNGISVYLTTWENNSGLFVPNTMRAHWDRIAINPHNPDGSPVGLSAAPNWCPGQPLNTCGAVVTSASPSPTGSPSPTPTSSGVPVATATPTPSPTPMPTPTSTATPTPTPTATASSGSAGCTLVIGYSQTYQWFNGANPTYDQFQSRVGDSSWELLWNGGAAAHYWADPTYTGWDSPIESTCTQNASTPDRLLLDVTQDAYLDQTSATAVSDMTSIIRSEVATAQSKYPSAKTVILQPVVGGPNNSVCQVGGVNVRASVNHPYIWQAINNVVNGTSVVLGYNSMLSDCSEYADSTGHLTDPDGRLDIATKLGNFYAGGSGGPLPTPTPTATPKPTVTPTPSPTPTPAPIVGKVTVNFDNNSNINMPLSGQYPTGLVDWGEDNWYLSGPWQLFTTNSLSLNGLANLSLASFKLLPQGHLESFDAFNGGTTASTIDISCTGLPTVELTVEPGQIQNLKTGWTGNCQNITLSSSNGWFTNFDNMVFADPTVSPLPSPTPSPTATPTPIPTPTPTPGISPTPIPSLTPVPSVVTTQTITFDNLTAINTTLKGQYPTGVIDWGNGKWLLNGPWQLFTTNSISYSGPKINKASFKFMTPRKLLSLKAYNGATKSSNVTLSCFGQPNKTVTLPVGQIVTINTGWTGNCSYVTIASTNGWNTNFDDLVIQ